MKRSTRQTALHSERGECEPRVSTPANNTSELKPKDAYISVGATCGGALSRACLVRDSKGDLLYKII